MAVRWPTVGLVVLLRLCGGSAGPDGGDDENYGRTVPGIEKCGFVGERHEVATRDGYTTTAFRMLQRGGGPGVDPVLLQHGFLSSSDAWFQLGASSLPCLLAAAGYDVWLPNSRGNSYSKAHSTYSTRTLQFWAFSFHEMAVYDLSATIDHVRSVTGAEKVSLVGHSTGGTLVLVLLSVLPEYNQRVAAAVSLAPVCFMRHTASHLLKLLAYTAPYFEKPLNWMTNGEIAPFPDPQRPPSEGFDLDIGAALGEVIDFNQMLRRELALEADAAGYLTDGTSLRTALHLAQLITRGNFSWYDLGKRNSVEYKRLTPPNYNLTRITATQIIMYSDADYLVVPKDVKRLCSELPEGVGVCYKVNKTGFQHSDFLSSYDAQQYVYDVLFADLDSESSETQRKPIASRGRAATAPEEDRPAAAEDETAEPSSEQERAGSSARGRPTIGRGRGKATTPAKRSRAPTSPDLQIAAVPPPRGMPPTSPEQEWASRSREEEAVPKSPEWGTSETSAREEVDGKPAVASPQASARPSSARGKQAASLARSRIASRVKGMAAEPAEPEGRAVTGSTARGGPPELEGGAPAGASAQERGAGSASPRGGGPATPARTSATAQEEYDPTTPVKVCRYYAIAGRLQKICYEEYV